MEKIILLSMFLLITTNITAKNLDEEKTAIEQTQTMMPQVKFGGEYSSVYDVSAQLMYANFLSGKSAMSILIEYGDFQKRLDVTLAFAVAENQRVKLSAEFLSQNNNYNFFSESTVAQVGQKVVGGEYEYITKRKFPYAFHIGGYYFSANDKDFRNKAFATETGNYIDYRHVIGASGGGVQIGPRLKPWRGANLKVGFGYDEVNFSPIAEPSKSSSGFGSNIYFTQRITKKIKLDATMQHREPYQQYTAGLSWLAYQNQQKGKELGFKLMGRYVMGDALYFSNESIVGLSLVYQWDGNPVLSDNKQCINAETSCGLLDWSTKSAARLPAVFVQKDEWVTAY